MSETGSTNQNEKVAKIRRKPERESVLTPTFSVARQAVSDRHRSQFFGGSSLQRQCDCGKHTIGGGICEECQQKQGDSRDFPAEAPSFFKEGMGYDFSQVRLHTDSNTVQTSRDIQAHAFIPGHNPAFNNNGTYQQETEAGHRFLAHELTHTVQQRTVSVIQRVPTPTPLPTTVPSPGPTDFQINQVGQSTTSRISFARNSSVLTPSAITQITAIKSAAPSSVRLIGFASADEPAATAQNRADAVKAVLTAPPNLVTVTSASGNAGATESSSNFVRARSVEVLVGAAAPTTVDCKEKFTSGPHRGQLRNPPKQPCPTMDPPTWTAFNAALPIAKNAMSRALSAVDPADATFNPTLVDRFFGNHTAATLGTLKTNLTNLQAHVNNLAAITQCGGQCDVGSCEKPGVIAYNLDVDAASTMTLCVPTFKSLNVNDRVRNLIHESAHGTSPLGGTPGSGTRDVAYRHERMLFHLSPAERLRNSDSYALFALFIRETQTTGNASAVPAGISTPANDTLTGFDPRTEQPALELALAKLEKRLTWAKDWTGQLYGQVLKVRTGALSWSRSWAKDLMTQAATRFPLTAPPTKPNLTDQTRVAGMLDRYVRMHAAVKRDLTLTRMATSVVTWPTAGTSVVASNSLQVGPDFFRATPAHQVSLLLEALARSTQDIEASFVPAYVTLAEWMHNQNP